MARCSDVKDYFRDPSTGLPHPCSWICDYVEPRKSFDDCSQRCPDLWLCLTSTTPVIPQNMKLPSSGIKTPTPSYAKQEQQQNPDAEPVVSTNTIIISVFSVSIVILLALIVVMMHKLCSRKKAQTPNIPDPERQSLDGHDSTSSRKRNCSCSTKSTDLDDSVAPSPECHSLIKPEPVAPDQTTLHNSTQVTDWEPYTYAVSLHTD